MRPARRSDAQPIDNMSRTKDCDTRTYHHRESIHSQPLPTGRNARSRPRFTANGSHREWENYLPGPQAPSGRGSARSATPSFGLERNSGHGDCGRRREHRCFGDKVQDDANRKRRTEDGDEHFTISSATKVTHDDRFRSRRLASEACALLLGEQRAALRLVGHEGDEICFDVVRPTALMMRLTRRRTTSGAPKRATYP